VIGTHGRSGFQRLLLGSVTEKLIRKATCPTLVVPPRSPVFQPARRSSFAGFSAPSIFPRAPSMRWHMRSTWPRRPTPSSRSCMWWNSLRC
jgi:hypothetical protein